MSFLKSLHVIARGNAKWTLGEHTYQNNVATVGSDNYEVRSMRSKWIFCLIVAPGLRVRIEIVNDLNDLKRWHVTNLINMIQNYGGPLGQHNINKQNTHISVASNILTETGINA